MKLNLTPPQTAWLDKVVNNFILVGSRFESYDAEVRAARKMRYKFSGSPSLVFLTGKERKLVRDLASFRAEALAANPTDELVTIRQILEVVPA